MNDVPHTPGPWTVEQISDSGGGTRLQIEAAAASTGRVCVLSRLDEGMANARLIAAAPALLEALRPFAAFAGPFDGQDAPDDQVIGFAQRHIPGQPDIGITLGMCRTAREVLLSALSGQGDSTR